MLGASFLPARLRHEHGQPAPSNPGYINRQITKSLQWVARTAFTHPIHTICCIALLASTSYVGLLEGSLLDHASVGNDIGKTDISSLRDNGKHLSLGSETDWKWQLESGKVHGSDQVHIYHVLLSQSMC